MTLVLKTNTRVASDVLIERLQRLGGEVRVAREKNPDVPSMPVVTVRSELSLNSIMRELKNGVARVLGRVPLLRNIASWGWNVLRVRRTARMALSANLRLDALGASVQSQNVTNNSRVDVAEVALGAQRAELLELRDMVTSLTQTTQFLADGASETLRQLNAARKEISFQQRRLNTLLGAGSANTPVAAAAEVAQSQQLDSYYVAFEDLFRGSREDVKQRMSVHMERMLLAGVGTAAKPVLDIGCGRGEWLELMKDNHLTAYGIDINSAMVEQTRSLGFDARCEDLLAHLRSLPDESVSAVTAFHVVEHLPFEVLVSFIDEALRVLISGGVLLFETPNPETVMVGASTFYNDPTHRNPIPPLPLQFLVGQRGFLETEIVRLHPFPESVQLKGDDENIARLNSMLFGPQDYAVVARCA